MLLRLPCSAATSRCERTVKITCALLALVLTVVTTHATAAPAPLLPDYRHTSWTANDGAPGQIVTMAQTTDGWLWLGTADGLYRFDGVAFERVPLPERTVLGRGPIYALLASSHGDLWIAYKWGGVAVLHPDGRVDDIAVPGGTAALPGAFGAMVEDGDGTLWALGQSGLLHLAGGAWHEVIGRNPHPTEGVRSLLVDQDGVLWASFDGHVIKRDRPGAAFVPAGPAGAHGSLMQSPDGRVWALAGAPERMVQLSGASARRRPARANQSQSRWDGQFDRDGNLWKLHCPDGACLLPASSYGNTQPATTLDPQGDGERLADRTQISSRDAVQVLEDREGNIWIATQAGLDRYQRNRVESSGLPGAGMAISLAADADGSVWAADANDGALYRLGIDGVPVRQAGVYARVVGVDLAGALLLVGKRSIERRLHGVVTQIPLPPGRDGKPADLTVAGTLDDGRVLWMASLETGLMGLENGVWKPRSAFHLPQKIIISAAGAPGQLWLADAEGGLTLYDGGSQAAKPVRYDAAMAGIATAVFASPEVMVAGPRGLAVLHRGAMHLLKASHADALRNISGMAVTPDGDRWLNGVHGIVHVRAADWQRTMADPQEPLRFTVLDARDGYPGQAATEYRLPSVVQGSAGALWFAATGGVARLATRTLQANPVAPDAQISHVSTAQAVYPATPAPTPALQLPPATRDLRIVFTAPALRRPEDVRFAWWMEGAERGWVAGGNRRAVSYTSLAPGHYRFHVRATNEDGASGGEAVQAIDIAPTLVQTAWFKGACALLLVLIGVALYRYRIRMLTARLSAHMQARASERERIARTLHDTYLQSVHALLLRVSVVAQSLPGGSPTRAQLDSLLADASSTVALGRGQVEQLRAGSPAALAHTLGDTVENVLARAAGPLRQCYPDVRYALQVTGTRRALAPEVLDEAGQIGAEALRNAFIHGGAANVDVQVDYGTSFSVLVRDDGRGLDEEVLAAGYRSGHWGLLGMRERAGTIKARLTLDSAPGTGTSVLLTVPGSIAYVSTRRDDASFHRRIALLANKLRG